jgi:hypothetical protein
LVGHGAADMAVNRHGAIEVIRRAKSQASIRTTRNIAGRDPEFLANIRMAKSHRPGLGALRWGGLD